MVEETGKKPQKDDEGHKDVKKASVPKTRKRLTLQERLALAAKKGSTAADKKYKNRKNDPKEEEKKTVKKVETGTKDQKDQSIKDVNKAQPIEAVNKPLPQPVSDNEYEAQLKAKQDKIDKILKEGMELSSKEVKARQELKRERQINEELSEKLGVEQKNSKMFAQKAMKLEQQLSTMNQYRNKLDNEVKKNQKLQAQVESLETQVGGLQKDSNELKRIRNSLAKKEDECNDLHKQIEYLKKENSQLETSKSKEVVELRRKLSRQEEASNDQSEQNKKELAHLEEKMEMLRIRNESLSDRKMNAKNDDKKQTSILQNQYIQAQENWKLIDSSYQKKISDLRDEMQTIKGENSKYIRRIKDLNQELKQHVDKYNSVNDSNAELKQRLDDIERKESSSSEKYQALNEKYLSLKKDYDSEKRQVDTKMKQLIEEKTRLNETLKLRTDALSEVPESNGQAFSPSFYLNDLDSSSVLATLKPKRISTSTSIGFGESATTPTQSSTNLSGGAHPLSLSMLQKHTAATDANVSGSDTFDASSTNQSRNLSNVQTVSKLSGKVRLLERELQSLRNENATISKAKQDASMEIVRLLKSVEDSKQNEDLGAKLTEAEKQRDTILVTLGEKSERCEELEADVSDLKDLVKQQVQEMVEMQQHQDK